MTKNNETPVVEDSDAATTASVDLDDAALDELPVDAEAGDEIV